MRNQLLNAAHHNQRAETAAFTVLGVAALFAIGGAFVNSDPVVTRPVEWNRELRLRCGPDSTGYNFYSRRTKSLGRPIRDNVIGL